MKQNILINIGRQLGSGGRQIARKLSDELNYTFYDRELLDLAARESGFSATLFERNDEKRGFVAGLFNNHTPLVGCFNFHGSKVTSDDLFKWQSDAIRRAAQESNCVFVGRCADYVLRDMQNVANIFITANIEYRIEQIMQRLGCDNATAEKVINKGDKGRATYYNYYTDKIWGHSQSYHLCINSSELGIDKTVDMIKEYLNKRFF